MIRLIGTMASLAWLAFMMWGAAREYRAAHPRPRDVAPGTRQLLGQLGGWLARRARKAAPKPGGDAAPPAD
jgi:hypothetical protein